MEPLHVRVEGRGPVALAFALFLGRLLGPLVTLRLPGTPDGGDRPVPTAVARRPLAISHGSRLLLERVARFPAEFAPITLIDVALAGRAGRVRLDADEAGLPALGWVTRHGTLVRALRDAAARHPSIGFDAGTEPSRAVPDIEVVADGDPGEDARVKAHGQSAVVADLVAPQAPAGVAVERFTTEGPLALLPLPPDGAASSGDTPVGTPLTLVWCADHDVATARAASPKADFERALQAAFGDALGPLTLTSTPVVTRLERRSRQQLVSGRTVWIGNAAQTLHPVAGQGLNLGLRDAHELADAIARGIQRGVEPSLILAAHARFRQPDRDTMTAVTDLLATGLMPPLLRPIQSAGLALVDALPPLRRMAARGFMFGWPRA